MANLSKAFSVLSRACDRLARMGVVDVHQRITARILPPEKCGAEDRAVELAQEAIAELHQRGLEVVAADLSLELEVPPLPSARLAGSTPVEPDFLSPPPIARAIGSAVLRIADELFPPPPAVPDQAHVTPASPLTPEDLEALPPPTRGPITLERAIGMLGGEPPAPEVPVPPARHEVTFGEGLGAGVEVGLDLASGPDATAIHPVPPEISDRLATDPPALPDGYTRSELDAIDRELEAEAASRRSATPTPSTPADRDQAEHIEDLVGGAPEAPSAPAVS